VLANEAPEPACGNVLSSAPVERSAIAAGNQVAELADGWNSMQ
jgi:hypothetical protein